MRIRPGIQEGLKYVRRPVRQQAPTAREERVRLKEVRNPPPLDVERTPGRLVRTDNISFEHDRLVPRTGHSEGGRKPRHPAARDDEPHTPKLSDRLPSGKQGAAHRTTP